MPYDRIYLIKTTNYIDTLIDDHRYREAEQFLSKSSLNSFLCTEYINQEIFRLVYQEFRGDKKRKRDITNSWIDTDTRD